jgi:CheY-like chemotaxis protein
MDIQMPVMNGYAASSAIYAYETELMKNNNNNNNNNNSSSNSRNSKKKKTYDQDVVVDDENLTTNKVVRTPVIALTASNVAPQDLKTNHMLTCVAKPMTLTQLCQTLTDVHHQTENNNNNNNNTTPPLTYKKLS